MTVFNLNQAAIETGKAKSTIFNALKSGKLSYIEKNKDGYKIDASELFRVFQKQQIEQSGTGENNNEILFLRRENELLREQLKREMERGDASDQERRQLLAMLTHQPDQHKADQPVSRLWLKLFGRK